LSREAFIEAQAAFQFGTCTAAPQLDLEALANGEAHERPSLIYHDFETGGFVPAARGLDLAKKDNGQWRAAFDPSAELNKKLKARRKADALSDLYQLGLKSPVMLDMNDAVRRPNAFPTFQYNRMAGEPNAILWPQRRVHEIGAPDFCVEHDPAEPPLNSKKPHLFWRGSLRGFSSYGGKPRNITTVVSAYLEARMSRKELLAHLNTVPRYAFVSRYFCTEGFDVGLSHPPHQQHFLKAPEIAFFEKPRVEPPEQRSFKYLICIQGTDVASSFAWQLGTNSVILKESYPWQVFFDGHFRPWKHFVPVAMGFADVQEKIAWCEANPDACSAMVEKRRALIPLLLDAEARGEALRRVVIRYNEFYARWRFYSRQAAG